VKAALTGVVFAAALVACSAVAQGGDPNAVAGGFYRVYSTFQPSDGIPDAKGRAKYAPFFSDGLNALIAQAGAAEDKFGGAHKDSPPLVEGDLFTSNFEGATSFMVAPCSVSGGTARCKVALVYQSGNDKALNWTDMLLLTQTGKGWAVDDIYYGGSWAFGNKGSLVDTLKHVISDTGG
jgi:hypothetical protein